MWFREKVRFWDEVRFFDGMTVSGTFVVSFLMALVREHGPLTEVTVTHLSESA